MGGPLTKVLEKVATGQKLNSARDDASAYSISEQMRSKLRALEQDVQNVQNGSAMLKIAEGGIQNIVDELRELRELAIDSANDSNSDDDRRIMQKVFDQKKENIDDIATSTNYNGKRLLSGRYYRPKNIPQEITPAGYVVRGGFVDGITDLFNIEKTGIMTKTVEAQTWANGREAYHHEKTDDDVLLNFSNAKRNGFPVHFPYDLDQQGFTILCTVPSCPSFFGFKFDAGMTYGTGEASGDESTPFYTIGIQGAKNSDEVVKALYLGLANALGMDSEEVGDNITVPLGDTLYLNRVGNQYTLNQSYKDFWIFTGYVEQYAPDEEYSLYLGGGPSRDWNEIGIHHGPRAGQATNFYVHDMHTVTLGIDMVNITNKNNARAALEYVDTALDYALGEATNVGASLARLEYMETNVSTEATNVQASESAIRDADMAKEMTDYARQNILMQASQSMLAQANQNSSSVLGLLQ